jgi:hypothetical protein
MKPIDQATQTVFADLNQRLIDATFDEDFPQNGSFTTSTVKGKAYWYYEGYDALTARKSRKYVGPAADEAITSRVNSFERGKVAFKTRLEAVRMLRAAGFPVPDAITGTLIERLAKAGFFRLRGVLVGTIAFQAYPGLVGARPERNLNTGDLDLAQDHGISVALDDTMERVLDSIIEIDATFREVPSLQGGVKSSAFVNDRGYKVEFLVPNRGSDDYASNLTAMPALGGVAAQPLRFLDFLIRNPVRSVILHSAGVSVTVPAPERYAVHKLIVATRRADREKIAKDVGQSAFLIEALAGFRSLELAEVWIEAWQRGTKWQDALRRGKTMLPREIAGILDDAIAGNALKFDVQPTDAGVD